MPELLTMGTLVYGVIAFSLVFLAVPLDPGRNRLVCRLRCCELDHNRRACLFALVVGKPPDHLDFGLFPLATVFLGKLPDCPGLVLEAVATPQVRDCTSTLFPKVSRNSCR